METYHRQPNDTVTVHHNVLRTIVRTVALGVEGVARLGHASGKVDRWLGRAPSEDGVLLVVEGDDITIEISLVVDGERNLQAISRKVQQQVSRTMQEYVGVHVRAVNVHIEDVVFGASSGNG